MATCFADTASIDSRAEIDDDVEIGAYCVVGPKVASAGGPGWRTASR